MRVSTKRPLSLTCIRAPTTPSPSFMPGTTVSLIALKSMSMTGLLSSLHGRAKADLPIAIYDSIIISFLQTNLLVTSRLRRWGRLRFSVTSLGQTALFREMT